MSKRRRTRALQDRQCWCGNTKLEPFGDLYARCPRCETLVVLRDVSGTLGHVTDDAKDFYGREYWFSHQRDLGFPDIRERARRDLPERCVYWLRAILRYCEPPAMSLELGCAHGGFVAMMRTAGFEAAGLDLSPMIVEFAKETFGVPVLCGPLEDQDVAEGSLDLVLAMDVLEHFVDPIDSVRRAASLLRPQGTLVFQTPCYPAGKSFDDLQAEHSPFLQMLQPQEHIYLFSRESGAALLEQVGFGHVSFEPALFPYDMFVFARRVPIEVGDTDRPSEILSRTAQGRLLRALLDLDSERTSLLELAGRAHADAEARFDQVEKLTGMLKEANADGTLRLDQAGKLTSLLEVSKIESADRFGQVQTLTRLLQTATADSEARLEQIHTLDRMLRESELDRAARLEQILSLTAMLKEANQDRAARLDQIHALTKLLRPSDE